MYINLKSLKILKMGEPTLSTPHEFGSKLQKVVHWLSHLDGCSCLIMAGFAEFLRGFSTNGQLVIYLGVFTTLVIAPTSTTKQT